MFLSNITSLAKHSEAIRFGGEQVHACAEMSVGYHGRMGGLQHRPNHSPFVSGGLQHTNIGVVC